MEYFHWAPWVAAWPYSLAALAYLPISQTWETEKSPWFLSNSWKHQCIINILVILNPEYMSYLEENSLYPSQNKETTPCIHQSGIIILLLGNYLLLVIDMIKVNSCHKHHSFRFSRITEWQNHRIVRVGRDLKDHLVLTPLSWSGTSSARTGCSEGIFQSPLMHW